MALHRFYYSEPLMQQQEVVLRDQLAHRILHVLRLPQGETITLFDGSGREFKSEIIATARQQVHVRVTDMAVGLACSPLFTHLVQAISRPDRMDYSLQKATELGVNRITPIVSDYSNFKTNQASKQKRYEHWQAVIIAAAEQCGRSELPILDDIIWFREFVDTKIIKHATSVILEPAADKSLHDLTCSDLKITFLVGAEGGFSANEVSAATSAGIIPVQLGPRVLRTETVAAVALGCLQFLWGDS